MIASANNVLYRPCVGVALFNKAGMIFVGERVDHPGAWQMPQGGIDPGETIEVAFRRELREEIGTDKADILKIMDRTLRYKLPDHLSRKLWDGKYGGQEQTWIAAQFTGTDADINLNAHQPAEFQAWKWVAAAEIIDLAVPFKRDTYREVLSVFGGLHPGR